MFSISPVFNRKSSKNKSGLYSVHLRVTIDRKSIYLKLKHFPKLQPKHWDSNFQQVKPSNKDAWKLNEILNMEKNKVNDFILNQLMSGKDLSLDSVKAYYYGNNENFYEWAWKFIRSKKIETYAKYKTLLTHMEKACPEFSFTKANLSRLKNYFDKLGHSGNTQAKSFSFLHALYNQAARDEIVRNYDQFLFDFLKFNRTKPNRTALLKSELEQLYRTEIVDQGLRLWRDQFCFLCFSGLYYRDLKNLDIEKDLKEAERGYYLTNERLKTGNTFVIPLWLFPEQMEIINRYRSEADLFPAYLSDQKFNEKIKLVAELCKVKKKLTNKVGRHTFTDLCISRGMPRQFVSKMLGHSNESTTQVYYEMNIEHFARLIE
jgi:site-specific recombinase XerD